MTVSFQAFGAARHVTGSKHLLRVGGRRILLDCGMVQGPRLVAEKANRKLPFAARTIDAVVLSHAHIDHCGVLPRLVREGFEGRIVCTDPTRSLLRLMLEDSARVQEADARHLAAQGIRYEPLYGIRDVKRTMKLVRSIPYHQETEVVPGVRVRFLDAGHILGSALVVLDVERRRKSLRICFTGDHGRKGMPILRDPERMPPCDVLITESTYGDRRHEGGPDMEPVLERVLRKEMRTPGRILVPAFAVGRTQHVVLVLGELMRKRRIPKMPIWVDTPLGREATKVMARHAEVLDEEVQRMLAAGRSPFFLRGVRYVADVEESKSLNSVRRGVIVAASGMCEGGRILHHLERSVSRPEDLVLLVGYQAEGTLGRKLQDGRKHVRIFDRWHTVKCRVRAIRGFSAHADYRELLSALRPLCSSVRQTFVVHGENGPALAFADRLLGAGFRNVEVPVHGQRFLLEGGR